MKKINWKTLLITCMVTLIPMLIGVVFYNQLPKQIPIHFNINNQPDSYTSKEIALFVIPGILTVVQAIFCIICDLVRKKEDLISRTEKVLKWCIPIISILVGILLVEYPLRVRLDIRMYICIALGIISIVTGNYFTDMDPDGIKEKSILQPKNENNLKLFSNIVGYTLILFGLIIILSIRFHPIASVLVTLGLAIIVALEIIFFKLKK